MGGGSSLRNICSNGCLPVTDIVIGSQVLSWRGHYSFSLNTRVHTRDCPARTAAKCTACASEVTPKIMTVMKSGLYRAGRSRCYVNRGTNTREIKVALQIQLAAENSRSKKKKKCRRVRLCSLPSLIPHLFHFFFRLLYSSTCSEQSRASFV